MKSTKPSYEILTKLDSAELVTEMLKHIENCGRQCYQSTHRITEDSAPKFIKMILERGHESVIEHVGFSVLFISNRGFSHEMVRHRIASFSQESTRFCNYSKDKFGSEINCIDLEDSLTEFGRIPIMPEEKHLFPEDQKTRELTAAEINYTLDIFEKAWKSSENYYNELIGFGITPEFARNVLPIGLKTSIAVTANLREWKEIFRQRAAKVAHPQMKELMRPLLKEIKEKIPLIFDEIIF